jgi:uracil permease
VVAGYFLALFMGLVDTAKISEAAWFALPKFQAPVYESPSLLLPCLHCGPSEP